MNACFFKDCSKLPKVAWNNTKHDQFGTVYISWDIHNLIIHRQGKVVWILNGTTLSIIAWAMDNLSSQPWVFGPWDEVHPGVITQQTLYIFIL